MKNVRINTEKNIKLFSINFDPDLTEILVVLVESVE